MIGKARRNGKHYLNPVPTSVGAWSTFAKVLWRYLTGREERIPKQTLGPFRTDTRVYEKPPASGLRVTWMGHSSMLVEIDGARVLVDPVWEQRTAPSSGRGRSDSSRPHYRWRRCRGSMWCSSRTTTTTILGLTPCGASRRPNPRPRRSG